METLLCANMYKLSAIYYLLYSVTKQITKNQFKIEKGKKKKRNEVVTKRKELLNNT